MKSSKYIPGVCSPFDHYWRPSFFYPCDLSLYMWSSLHTSCLLHLFLVPLFPCNWSNPMLFCSSWFLSWQNSLLITLVITHMEWVIWKKFKWLHMENKEIMIILHTAPKRFFHFYLNSESEDNKQSAVNSLGWTVGN